MTDYFDSLQQYGRDRFEAATAASASLAKEFGSVVEESQNYSKKSFEDAQTYFKKLLSVKTVDEAVKAHTSFLDAARQDFIDHAGKYGDLYFNFARTLLKSGNGAGGKIANEGFVKSKSA
ncbi:MAG TPA: phasin family protein [Methylocystis sp.]|nr:phasin family protein [Methylocystis sp.]